MGTLSNKSLDLAKRIHIFPNPTTCMINIETTIGQELKAATVSNTVGQILYTTTMDSNNRLRLNYLPKGMYYQRRESEDQYAINKILLE